MSRTLYDIAASGLDDLYAMQTEFSQIETLFSTLASNFPTGSNLREFADFALSVNKDWADKAAQWVDCMDDELDGFPEENRAHFAKHLRREALRAGGCCMSARRSIKKQIGLRSKPEGKTAWDRLPFVGKDHGKYQNSWDVPLTGGYFGGIEVGEVVARMFLKYLRDTRDDPLKMGSMHLGMVLDALYDRKPTTKDEESALRGQRVGFRSEIAYWLDAAAERLGSSFDAIPERTFIQQANEALLRTDAQLMAAIAARGEA